MVGISAALPGLLTADVTEWAAKSRDDGGYHRDSHAGESAGRINQCAPVFSVDRQQCIARELSTRLNEHHFKVDRKTCQRSYA